MSHARYFKFFLGSFSLVCLVVAGTNYSVDPYALFGTPEVNGFNKIKPTAYTRTRIAKPYQQLRHNPQTLIGGNSRPEMGLDPSSKCWLKSEQPVYNAGVTGAGLYRQTRILQQAMESGRVKRVLLGLDFQDFLVHPVAAINYESWPSQPFEFETRLTHQADGSPNTKYTYTWIQDRMTGLFSLDALTDSITTVSSQNDAHADTQLANGFNPARGYLKIITTEGQAVLFSQKNKSVLRRMSDPNLAIYQAGGEWSTEFEILRRFLRRANYLSVDVVLFINPYHAEYLASIQLVGKWPLFNTWKRAIFQMSREEGHVPLWDFNTFDGYSTEPSPALGDLSNSMRWFWEPAHYRRELGELMLARMLGRECAVGQDRHFGLRLDEHNIQAHLDELAQGLASYRENNVESWQRLQQAMP